jgi:cytochrome P450
VSSPTPFLSAEFFADPYPTYRALQARGPAVWVDELGGWLVTRMDGCREVLSDHQRFSSARASRMIEAMVPGFALDELLPRIVCDAITQDFLFLDPPQHGVVRRGLVIALHTATTELEPRLASVAEELVRALERLPHGDIADFAGSFSALAMGMMLGLTPEQASRWQQWTYEAGPLFGASAALADDARRACMLASVQALNESMAELLFLTKVQTPFLTHVRQLVQTLAWTPEEALGAAVQLYAAGVLTTGDALALGVLVLLTNPSQLALVLAGAVPLDQVIDEILRFTSPTQVMHRVVRADTELQGCRLQRGDLVYAVIAAANRDPRCFSQPDCFDVMRADAGKHIGFGVGVHRCIGAALARLELRAALTAIVPRLGQWTVEGRARYRDYSMCFRGIEALTFISRTASTSTAA